MSSFCRFGVLVRVPFLADCRRAVKAFLLPPGSDIAQASHPGVLGSALSLHCCKDLLFCRQLSVTNVIGPAGSSNVCRFSLACLPLLADILEMCTALFAFGVNPRLLFFLAFNRDEFLDRYDARRKCVSEVRPLESMQDLRGDAEIERYK